MASKPDAPTFTQDEYRGQVAIGLPTDYPDTFDYWQIARRVGNNTGQASPALVDPNDIVALVAGTRTTWIDQFPAPKRASYWIRARVSSDPITWSPWSDSVVTTNPTTVTTLRERLLSPFNVLELTNLEAIDDTITTAVESAYNWRFPVSDNAPYIFRVYYRAALAASTDNELHMGFRYYQKDGTYISEDYESVPLTITDGQGATGMAQLITTPPTSTSKLGLFFEIFDPDPPTSTAIKVRIERIELYRAPTDKDTGWEYIQNPDTYGYDADEQELEVDQTAFTYEGVGFSYLSAPPVTAAFPNNAYRETTTPDDDITYLATGEWTDLVLHDPGPDFPTVIAIERLVDNLLGATSGGTSSDDDSLWNIIYSTQEGALPLAYDVNLVLTPDAEISTTGWTTAPNSDPLQQNGITYYPSDQVYPTLGVTNSSPIDGAASFITSFRAIGEGATYPLSGHILQLGHTYHAAVKIKSVSGAAAISVNVVFGNNSPAYATPTGVAYLTEDTVSKVIETSTTVQTIDLYWTPRMDAPDAFFGIFALQSDGAYVNQFMFDDVHVEEVLGFQLPVTEEWAELRIPIPGTFDPCHATPYRARLVSGKMRAHTLARDTVAKVDISQDFLTVLQSIGEIRNATKGELEFQHEHVPPRVIHHARRGKDHSQIEGGLDLRFGKNLVSRPVTKQSLPVCNRVLVVGYGSDITQLVLECQSYIDVQGRLPTDPNYKVDANGASPTFTNYIQTATMESGVSGWTVSNGSAEASTSQAHSGTHSLEVTSNSGEQGMLFYACPGIPARLTYTAGIWVYAASGVVLAVAGTDSSNSTYNTQQVTPDGTWTWIAITFYSENDSPGVNISTTTPGAIFYVDDAMLIAGSEVPTDGFTGDTDGASWSGESGNSYSTYPNDQWDRFTGGISEDIYGIRYGLYRDATLATTYQAQQTGQGVVEASAWPLETYNVTAVDLDSIPQDIEPGDIIPVHYGGKDLLRRVTELSIDVSQPRALGLTLGDNTNELSATKVYERLSKDISVALSALSDAATSAASS